MDQANADLGSHTRKHPPHLQPGMDGTVRAVSVRGLSDGTPGLHGRDALTRFHSRTAPSITVADYLRRVVRYTNLERSCLLITLHYIDQMCSRLPRFTISSLTVHRFIIASVCVSTKALCDAFCTNSHYAKIGGIRLAELNVLEREFLSAMDWRLVCSGERLQEYYVNLARSHSSGAFVVEDPPPEEEVPPVAVSAEATNGGGEEDEAIEEDDSSSSSESGSSSSSISSSPGESSATNVPPPPPDLTSPSHLSEAPSGMVVDGDNVEAVQRPPPGRPVQSPSVTTTPKTSPSLMAAFPPPTPSSRPPLSAINSLHISASPKLSPSHENPPPAAQESPRLSSSRSPHVRPRSTTNVSASPSAGTASPVTSASYTSTPRKRPRQGSVSSPLQIASSHPSPRRRRVNPPITPDLPTEAAR